MLPSLLFASVAPQYAAIALENKFCNVVLFFFRRFFFLLFSMDSVWKLYKNVTSILLSKGDNLRGNVADFVGALICKSIHGKWIGLKCEQSEWSKTWKWVKASELNLTKQKRRHKNDAQMAGLYCTRMPNVDLATQIMDDVYNDFHFRWQIYRLFIVQQTCVTDFEFGTES